MKDAVYKKKVSLCIRLFSRMAAHSCSVQSTFKVKRIFNLSRAAIEVEYEKVLQILVQFFEVEGVAILIANLVIPCFYACRQLSGVICSEYLYEIHDATKLNWTECGPSGLPALFTNIAGIVPNINQVIVSPMDYLAVVHQSNDCVRFEIRGSAVDIKMEMLEHAQPTFTGTISINQYDIVDIRIVFQHRWSDQNCAERHDRHRSEIFNLTQWEIKSNAANNLIFRQPMGIMSSLETIQRHSNWFRKKYPKIGNRD